MGNTASIKYNDPFALILEQLSQVQQQNAEINLKLERLTAKANEDQFLTIDQTRKMWQPAVSRQTVHAWQQKGLLKRHDINGKPYFLKSEVMAACKEVKRFTPISK